MLLNTTGNNDEIKSVGTKTDAFGNETVYALIRNKLTGEIRLETFGAGQGTTTTTIPVENINSVEGVRYLQSLGYKDYDSIFA